MYSSRSKIFFFKFVAYISLIFTFYSNTEFIPLTKWKWPTQTKKNAREPQGLLDSLENKHISTKDPHCSSACWWIFAPVQIACSRKCLYWPRGAGANQALGKEVKGRGMSATETGNKRCVLSSPSGARTLKVHAKFTLVQPVLEAVPAASRTHAGERYEGLGFFSSFRTVFEFEAYF